MCIRDRVYGKDKLVEDINHPIDLSYRQTKAVAEFKKDKTKAHNQTCLLYTSDAADERSSVDLGGRRIIKKKKKDKKKKTKHHR